MKKNIEYALKKDFFGEHILIKKNVVDNTVEYINMRGDKKKLELKIFRKKEKITRQLDEVLDLIEKYLSIIISRQKSIILDEINDLNFNNLIDLLVLEIVQNLAMFLKHPHARRN